MLKFLQFREKLGSVA